MSVHIPTPVRQSSPVLTAPSVKAGPVGPGAGVLMTEWLLPSVLGTEPQQRMAKALKLGTEVDWIRGAERIISGKVSSCDWQLQDPEGEVIGGVIDGEVDDGKEWKGNPLALDALRLLQGPQAELSMAEVGRRQTRRQQMGLTSRHMGLAGNSAWFLDQLDGNGCPHAILYIRPDRLTPKTDDRTGVLQDWILDKRAGSVGTPLGLDNVALFQLQSPDAGVFAVGLIESSMAKAVNSNLIDRHFSALLASGGRISGVMSPKEGIISDDNVYNQLVADWRNITEQPEAARRLQIVRAPVEFTSTVQSANDMQLMDLMDRNRDALLSVWGVPLTLLNGQNAGSTGLNGGMARKYDEAALWQGAVHDRLTEVQETIQSCVLDRWEPVLGGWAPQLVFLEPEFDDDDPKFDKLQKSIPVPLRNAERRDMIGLPPFGDPKLDNQIVMPVNVAEFAMAPDPESGKIPESPLPEPPPPPTPIIMPPGSTPPGGAPGGSAPTPPANGAASAAKPGAPSASPIPPGAGKASLTHPDHRRARDIGTVRLREQMQRRVEPKVQDTVHAVLQAQADDVARHIERNWELIKQHPHDETLWWPDGKRQDQQLLRALEPALTTMAGVVHDHVKDALE